MAKITKRTNTNKGAAFVPKSNKYALAQTDATIKRILEGDHTLKDLQNVTDKAIDFSQCKRKISTIQKIYSAGSQVGACTVVAGNMYTVKITEETMAAYKESLKMLKKREDHVTYTSVWVEGVNKFTNFVFSTGHKYTYYVVTDKEIEELAKKISEMDKDSVTIDELNQLQADLPPFIRAWQESSIDCSKDKDKVFKKQYSDFFKKLNVVSTHLKSEAQAIKVNLNTNKQLHRAGRTKDMKFEITLPLEGYEEPVYLDMLGTINLRIAKKVEEYFNGSMLDLYKGSDRNFYEQFADCALAHPELAWFIQQVYSLCTQAYHEDVKITKEQYSLMRNAIYTKAEALNVPVEEVVKVAVSTAMRYIKETTAKDGSKYIDLGMANVQKYSSVKVSSIFKEEYEVLRTNQPKEIKLDLLYVEKGVEIKDGETVEFVAGFSVDDTVEVEQLFTGTAINKGGTLYGQIDVYDYTPVTAVITVDTFSKDATTANLETDKGEFAAEFFENNNTVILTGKKKNVLVSEDKVTLVAKVVYSPELLGNVKAKAFTIVDRISFELKEERQRITLLVLSK